VTNEGLGERRRVPGGGRRGSPFELTNENGPRALELRYREAEALDARGLCGEDAERGLDGRVGDNRR
jgi:hypothetical protein